MSDEVRPLRQCDICHQVDDHPRHKVVGLPGTFEVDEAFAEEVLGMDLDPAVKNAVYKSIQDTTDQLRHMDCCAAAGCPDGSCNALISETLSKGYVKGAKLVKHLTSGAVDDIGQRLNEVRTGSEN